MSNQKPFQNSSMKTTAYTPASTSEITVSASSERLPSPSYKAISIPRNGVYLFLIILGNAICGGAICICFWHFSQKSHLIPWEKRVFNTLSLLLSAMLTLGIGYLCDTIGLLARGAILQRTALSVDCIGYVMRGSIFSYALLFIKKPNLWMVFIYLVFSVLGRFSIAFLGFSYQLDEKLNVTAPIFRPDWMNCTVSHQSANSASNQQDRAVLTGSNSWPWELTQIAQRVKGPSWTRPRGSLGAEEMRAGMNLSMFASDNVLMEIVGDTVIMKYQFQDFRESRPVFAEWEAKIETKCQSFQVSPKNLRTTEEQKTEWTGVLEYEDNGQNVTLNVFNTTGRMNLDRDSLGISHSRWIHAYQAPMSDGWDDAHVIPPDIFTEAVEGYWYLTHSAPQTPHQDELSDYVPSNALLYRCSVLVNDMSSVNSSAPPWNSTYAINPTYAMNSTLTEGHPTPVTIFGRQLYEILIRCFMFRLQQDSHRTTDLAPNDSGGPSLVYHTDYYDAPQEQMLNYGTSRQDRTASELWLAAYIGNHIGNTLGLLNDFLRPIEIRSAFEYINTTLVVRWSRVAAILGGLLLFQVLLAIAALLFCKGTFEIVDDVSTLSSMYGNLPPGTNPGESEKQNWRKNYEGYFIPQGKQGEFRWVFRKKQD